MDTQHGYEAQKFRKDMEHKKRHGKTAGTLTLLIQTLVFPLLSGLGYGTGFPVWGSKGRKNANLDFFLSRSALSLFFAVLGLFFASHSRAWKRYCAKKRDNARKRDNAKNRNNGKKKSWYCEKAW
jgi:hypothetical protein